MRLLILFSGGQWMMNFLKMKLYIELLALSFGILGIVYIVPMQVFVEGKPRILTLCILMFLWCVIVTHNMTFHELWDKVV